LHVILNERDSLTWSLEGPKDELTEEDLDQTVKSANEEEQEGENEEELQHSNGHNCLQLHSRTSVNWWIHHSDSSTHMGIRVVRQIEQTFQHAM
jgi:hypothetical protein